MGRPLSEGGKRCAAHTRLRYERTPATSLDWPDVARDYASTPEGRERITLEADEAADMGDRQTEVLLRAAVMRGDTVREANRETARLASTAPRPRTVPGDDIERVRGQFGVDLAQVMRDHAVSHVLRPSPGYPEPTTSRSSAAPPSPARSSPSYGSART